jgi:hypothetical protein
MATITQWIINSTKLMMVLPILIFIPAGCNFNSFSSVNKDESAGFNGSFEIVKDGLPVNWYVYKPAIDTTQTKLVCDTIAPHHGKQSLKFNVSKCSPVGGWHSPGIFQETAVEPGKTYVVSFWIKNHGCKNMIRMDCFKAGTEDPDHPRRWISCNDSIPDWQKHEYEFVFSNEFNQFRFEMNILSPGIL